MWNNPQAAAFDGGNDPGEYGAPPPEPPPAPSAAADPFAEISWTAEQLQRMEGEWRRLQRAFAYHPHVTLTPTRDDPPSAYQVDYRLTTLVVNPRTSQLEYVSNATVQVILPPGFPDDAPVVRPVTPLFHPNVSYEGVYVEGLWHPNETLLSLIRKVGDILAYRSFDPDYTVNPAAMDWLAANQAILPIDQQANLSPAAGGEPLARICKYGPQSLDSMKQSIQQTQTGLLGSTPPDPQTVRDYSRKTRLALNLFLEKDVPDEVQARASELENAARELVDLLPLCDFLRDRKRRVVALRQGARQLHALRDPLVAEVDKLVGLVEAGDPEEPMVALKLIPEAARLQPVQLALPKLIGDAENRIGAIRAGLAGLEGPGSQSPLIPPDSLLGKRLERDLATTAGDVEVAKQEGTAALAEVEPVLRRATIEAVALDFAARWREYLDMATKARAMERQIREWGAEGLQAYYIQNEGGRYGPYQFEQSVDLGTGDLVARSLGGKAFELRDPKADTVLGTTKNGTLVVALASSDAAGGFEGEPASYPTQFTITERCDDLMVLLEFLRRSTIETVQKFATYNGAAESWAGKVCRLLARPEVKKALEDELARAARRWRHTIVDLAALGPWKERLATYFLLHRCSETFPALVGAITDRKQKHSASKKRLNEIMARCSRDLETGQMIIPPRFSRQYHEELSLQEECVTTVKQSTVLLKSLIAQLTARLKSSKLLGKDTRPQLRALPLLPESLATLPLTDGTLGNLIAPLEELLQLPLGGPSPEAAEPEAAAPVAAEGDEGAEAGYAESGEAYAETSGEYGEPAESQAGFAAEGAEVMPSGEVYAGEGALQANEDSEFQAQTVAVEQAPQEQGEAYADDALISEPSVPDEQAASGEEAAPPPMQRAVATPAAAPAPRPAASAAPPPRATPPAAPPVPPPPTVADSGHAVAVDDDWFDQSQDSGEAGDPAPQNDDLVFGFDEEPPAPPFPPPAPPKKK
jgi:ubiquitin-protein ligase